ncbi:MAG TPA: D-alanyl-D-alanine carboxypeptidase [Candidatus Methanoperedens sp.]|nr:D-alanyl-D-alanine carboxypeptidase [Candidatus Methanoperedens sp.]
MFKKIINLSLFGRKHFYYGLIFGVGFCLAIFPNSYRFTKIVDIFSFKHPSQPVVENKIIPNLSTNYYILLDSDTNQILVSKNENVRVYPASTTKLATALTALNVYPLEEVVSIPSDYVDGKVMDLKTDEKVTIKTLVAGLLIYSANDAAYNLANHHPKGVDGFIDQMNVLVKKYNLNNTHFVNFDGLHSPEHYSTPYDLAQLGRLASQNPTLRQYVKTKEMNLSDIYGQMQHHVVSTNELLGLVPEIEGLKTGWTPEASGSFIGLININGHYLISVVAQSEDRFNDTKILINWAKENLTWRTYQ